MTSEHSLSNPTRVRPATAHGIHWDAFSLFGESTNIVFMPFTEIYAALEGAEPDQRFARLGDPFAHLTALTMLTTITGLPLFALDMPATGFSARFPKHSIPPEAQQVFGRELTRYQTWRRLLLDCQMLATGGIVDTDPWDSLRRLARLILSRAAANNLYNVSARVPLGLAPYNLDRDHALALDAEMAEEFRQAFRAGLGVIDRLHHFELARLSGLLPSSPIGFLPKPSSHLTHAPLPCHLHKLYDHAPAQVRSALPFVWRLGVAACIFESCDDPTPHDLIAEPQFQRLRALDPEDFGFNRPSARTYRAYLRRIAHHIDPQGAKAVCLDPVSSVWKELCQSATEAGTSSMRISALRAVARPAIEEKIPPSGLTRHWIQNQLKQQSKGCVKLFRSGCYLLDELADQSAVPANLLPRERTGVDRIRSRPGQEKPARQTKKVEKQNALCEPVREAWVKLFAGARKHEIEGKRLHPLYALKSRALADHVPPCGVSGTFIGALMACADQRARIKLSAAARLLDELRDSEALRPMLPPEAIGTIPDRRKNAHDLPVSTAGDLEALLAFQGGAPSTRREARIAVRALAERLAEGLASSLQSVLDVDVDAIDWGKHTEQSHRYRRVLHGLWEFQNLPWTPAWRALQRAVVDAGVSRVENPVPALLAHAQGRSPLDLDLCWARDVDRNLRRPNHLSHHGRADLARTFACNVARLDALRDIPSLAQDRLLPPRIGPIR